MSYLRIELLNPKARDLLNDLAKLELIRIEEETDKASRLTSLLAKLRSQESSVPDENEINEEIGAVRKARKD